MSLRDKLLRWSAPVAIDDAELAVTQYFTPRFRPYSVMPYNLFVRSLKTERGRRKGAREVVINQELETEDSDLITSVYVLNTHDQVIYIC